MIIFNQNPFLNKSIVSLLLITISLTLVGGGLFYPKKTQAQVLGTGDVATESTQIWGWLSNVLNWVIEFGKWAQKHAFDAVKWAWEKAETWQNHALKIAAAYFRKMLLDYMVNEIVEWIQGNRGGGPKIIPDWEWFLATAADMDIKDFLNELGLGFLCDPFAFELRIALAEPRPFWERADCTIDDVIDNIQDFYNDFSKGGWTGWIKLTQPQNNFYGAYLTGLDEKERRRALAVQAASAKAQSGAGFLGDERCVKCYWIDLNTNEKWTLSGSDCEDAIEPDECLTPEAACDFVCTETQIRTPGKIVADTLQESLVKDIKWLENNEEWESYVVAIVDALINRLTREGVGWITSSEVSGTSGYSPGSPYYTSPYQEPEADTISPVSNVSVVDPTHIEITSNEPGDIYYTVNGLDPKNPASNPLLYTKPIEIIETTFLRWYSIDEAGNQETTQSIYLSPPLIPSSTPTSTPPLY